MKADVSLILLSELVDARRDVNIRRGGDLVGSERARHLEAFLDLLVRPLVAETVIHRVDLNPSIVEALAYALDFVHWRVPKPGLPLFRIRRQHLVDPEFRVAQTDIVHAADASVERQIAEAVRLCADYDP